MLAATALCACALPEAHKVRDTTGAGPGGSGGAGPNNALQLINSCASADGEATRDLDFPTSAFTVELWYQPITLPPAMGYDTLVCKGGSNDVTPGWSIYLATESTGGTYVAFGTSDGMGTRGTLGTAPGTIVEGRNYHIVVVRKGMTGTIWMLDEVAGQTIHAPTPEGMVLDPWDTSELFTLGSIVRTGDTSCDASYNATGVMDDVRIFARERSSDEFNADYRERIPPLTEGLVAYWPMDESDGNAVPDVTDPAHQLLLSGTVAGDYLWMPSPFDD